jgi:hypothetical protein
VLSSTHGCARRGGRTTRAAISTAAALVATAALAGPASANLSAAGPVDGSTGFPESYTDAAGQTVDLCVDPPECGADASAPNAPGGEAVYWSAETSDITRSGGGTVAAIYAVEAAFGGDNDDTPITFTRAVPLRGAGPGHVHRPDSVGPGLGHDDRERERRR